MKKFNTILLACAMMTFGVIKATDTIISFTPNSSVYPSTTTGSYNATLGTATIGNYSFTDIVSGGIDIPEGKTALIGTYYSRNGNNGPYVQHNLYV